MTTRPVRRACARFSLLLLPTLPLLTSPASAETLAAFTFDNAGQFTTAPSQRAAQVADAAWRDDANRIGSTAGNPGLALVTSGFTTGNTLHLDLSAARGQLLELSALRFDIRVSATGPTRWQWLLDGVGFADGAATTTFRHFDLALSSARRGTFALALAGAGASSAGGTLRLDNVQVEGSARPVPIPGSWFLMVTPALGALLRRWRLRYWPESAADGVSSAHSRQPSSNGKYRPSLIGRGSSTAMARP